MHAKPAMKPILWGAPLWQAMFSCAYTCSEAHFEELREMLLVQLPLLLPCEACRKHWVERLPHVNRRAHGEPRTPDGAVRWLYYLKDEVNKSILLSRFPARLRDLVVRTSRASPPFDDVSARFALHGGAVDDVVLADVLVLVAINADRLKRQDVFEAFCVSLATLLPLPSDSQFVDHLRSFGRSRTSIVNRAVRAARAARTERGLPTFDAEHYKRIAAS